MFGKTLGLLVFTSFALTNISSGQMNNIDTKHVADDAFCVIRIDVERVVTHLKKSKKDYERISDQIKEETGMDISSLKCMTFQFSDQADEDYGEPSFAMTMEFKKDFDREKILNEFVDRRSYEKDTINGKTYMKADRAGGPHMYFESDRKFTAATQGGIKSVLKNGGGMNQNASQLKSAPPGSEMTFVFNRTKKFEDAIEAMIRPLRGVPAPFNVQDLVSKGESGFAVINLASGEPISIQVELSSAAAAEKTKKELESLIELGKPMIGPTKSMLEDQIKDMDGNDRFETMQRDAMKVGVEGLVVADKILNSMKVTSKNKLVDIKVKQMGGLTELADLVVQGMQMWVMGVSSADAPPKAIDEAVEKSAIK